ncbi:MAG: Uma2 family endonuclease [Gemmataceae bacterium]
MQPTVQAPASPIDYPDSDGKPMSDNTLQFHWIQLVAGNLMAQYRERADVFVAGDLLWYPVEGEATIRTAPDALVVMGRPPGYRGSYRQWEEDGVPVTVAFEVLSPNNTPREMADKLIFYDEHGVDEYYVIDPDHHDLEVYVRGQATLRRIRKVDGFVSPRLGIRFDLSGPELVIYRPDGRPFLPMEAIEAERAAAVQRAEDAQRRAVQAELQTAQVQQDLERLTQINARMVAISRRMRLGQATAEELAELERLEAELGGG